MKPETSPRRSKTVLSAGERSSAWERIRHLHPGDIVSIVAGLPRNSREAMVHAMTPDTVLWMLRQMNPVVAGRVGTRLGVQLLTFALRQVHPSQALATLRRIPMLRSREVAESLQQPQAATELLAYSLDTAGSLMTAVLPTVDIDEAARERLRAVEEIRDKLTHIYALGEGGSLAGQISIVDLALADSEDTIRSFATSIVATVRIETPVEECARFQRHYNLTQLPVVEGDRLTGVILAESLLSATVEHDTRQMQQVASVAGETVDGALYDSIRTRLPWLTVNLGTTFLAAATVALFESTLTPGGRARRVPARGRGTGRDRRHADADAHRSSDRPWGVGGNRRTAAAGPGGHPRDAAWGLARGPGRGNRSSLEAEPRPGAGVGDIYARQHDDRRLCRGGGATIPATNRPGPGGRLRSASYDGYGRVRLPAVPGHRQGGNQPHTLGQANCFSF